ncbi:MAG: hypothetical protein IJE84_01100 [Clostridia bacterium]|nr:hypothetical protein [Clostridia bacterium]
MTEYDDPIVTKIKGLASFPIDVECDGWPDVIFNIIFDRQPDRAAAQKCVSALEQYMYAYDRIHFLRPIHYVSDIDSLPEPESIFSVCIHMDFGNASPKALIGAVKAITDTKLNIYHLVLE